MDDWGLYLTDDDEYDANTSASCFAEPSTYRVAVGEYMPFDFPRKTRPVKDFPRWKASELKFDQNYLGPVSYKKFLNCCSSNIAINISYFST
jgi:hypothetical protein